MACPTDGLGKTLGRKKYALEMYFIAHLGGDRRLGDPPEDLSRNVQLIETSYADRFRY